MNVVATESVADKVADEQEPFASKFPVMSLLKIICGRLTWEIG